MSMQMYMVKHRISHNWRSVELNSAHRLRILKGHDDHVVSHVIWVAM